jgi:hypothetical protein
VRFDIFLFVDIITLNMQDKLPKKINPNNDVLGKVKKIAERIIQIRNGEKKQIAEEKKLDNMLISGSTETETSFLYYNNKRGGISYAFALGGLKHAFEYAKTLSSKIILDIGAGKTIGISHIQKSKIGEGLEFKATVLTRDPDIEHNLGFGNVILTSAEVLRGIEPNSIAGIVFVQSLTYTEFPEVVVERIDNILVPGGFVKGQFPAFDDIDEKDLGRNRLSETLFEQEFEKLGYKIYRANRDTAFSTDCIFFAVKPPIDTKIVERVFKSDLRRSVELENANRAYEILD